MKRSKAKFITAALSGALMLSVIGGVSSVTNSGKGTVVKAYTTEKSKEEIRKVILQRWPGATILKLRKDWDDGRYTWEGKIRVGRQVIEFEVTSNGRIFDVDYDD